MVDVSIIEYGIGNVRSVFNAILRIGARPSIASDGATLMHQNPDRIILPGVGAIGQALENLRGRGFEPVLDTFVRNEKTPFCGICVGMQMLGSTCEEFGNHRGLGWIPGHVGQLNLDDADVILPHMGWNTVSVKDPATSIIGALDGHDAYFAHTYTLKCEDRFVLSTTEYGGHQFVSAVKHGHIIGVQFHPEKSSKFGDALLREFVYGKDPKEPNSHV